MQTMATLALALAVALLRPVRAAACSAVWDSESASCVLVWNDSVYPLPAALGGVPSADECVQRVWCSGSGAVARRTEDGVVTARLATEDTGGKCGRGYYDDMFKGCTECPVGYYCMEDEKHICPGGTDNREIGHSSCAVPPGRYWEYDRSLGMGNSYTCEPRHYCPGGYEGMYECPRGTWCGFGCVSRSQCH